MFYNRKEELNYLHAIHQSSKEKAEFTLITGRRRIGKTSLIIESVKNQRHLYLFVSRKNEALLCADVIQVIQKEFEIPIFGQIVQIDDIFELLLIYRKHLI